MPKEIMPLIGLPKERVEAAFIVKREKSHLPKKQPTKQVEPLQLRKLFFSLLLIFTCFTASAQEPSLYLPTPDSTCTQLLGPNHDSIALDALGYQLNEEWCRIGVDTFQGFWLHQRFFVPDRGIVLSIMDCGVTYDYVPHFGIQEPVLYNSRWDRFLHTKNQPVATWSRILGYGLMGLGGYFGSEGERQRVVNGLDSKAFHVNRDLSLACAFSAGASFTLSWGKNPDLKWWDIGTDVIMGSLAWYAVAQKNWESYK